MIKLKRIYEDPSPHDGCRVLVERLWPRGLTKERAAVDLWLKDVAPSPELRRMVQPRPGPVAAVPDTLPRRAAPNKDAVKALKQKAKEGTITLVYAARDEEHNGAVALKRILQGH